MIPTSTLITKNNEGVRLLGEEEYEKAAEMFREAFLGLQQKRNDSSSRTATMESPPRLSSKILDGRRHRYDERHELFSEEEDVVVSNDATSIRTESSQRHKRERHATDGSREENHSRRKRQRRQTPGSGAPTQQQKHSSSVETTSKNATTTTTTPSEPLGRPLWLDPKKNAGDNDCQRVRKIYASSILYNYGYACQRLSTKLMDQRQQKRDDYDHQQRSMELDEEAMRIYIIAIRLTTLIGSPVVLWMSCHNLQQLLQKMYDDSNNNKIKSAEDLARKHQLLERRKTHVLRSLSCFLNHGNNSNNSTTNNNTSSPSFDPVQSCLIVVSMLGIGGGERSNRPAASA